MKKFLTTLLICLLLIGCFSASHTPSAEDAALPEEPPVIVQPNDSEEEPAAEPIQEEEPQTKDLLSESDPEEDTLNSKNNSTEQSKLTDLFETIYIPYAQREKAFVFDAVKSFVQTTEYKAEITEPTSQDIGSIVLTDENDNYVFFAFNLVNDIEIITTVSYHDAATNSEVSLNNYSSDGSPSYDIFNTHVIGESPNHVNSTDEQRDFLVSLIEKSVDNSEN